MNNTSPLLIALILALLFPLQDASAERATDAHASALDAISLAVDARSQPTYGDLLVDLARSAATRAAASGASDHAMDAISDLAIRWLSESGPGARVWDQTPRSAQSATLAVRNAERSLWRTQRRHERNASALPANHSIEPGQEYAVQLAELLQAFEPDDQHILLQTAQGVSSRELGAELGISADAVRQRLSRLRTKLRRAA